MEFWILSGGAVLCLALAFFLRGKSLDVFSTFLHIGIGIFTLYPVWILFTGGTPLAGMPEPDRLSAFFILPVNIVCIAGKLYSLGYLRLYKSVLKPVENSLHQAALLLLHAGMLGVLLSNGGLSFLFSWECMGMASFLLVIFDSRNKQVLRTGIHYIVQMHIAFFLLVVGFAVVGQETGSMSWEAVGNYFSTHFSWPVFLLFFIGFGFKAGLFGLHTWLPHAHPAAPSHVSGIMSGVMVKMGLYGIIQLMSCSQSEWKQLSLFLLVVSFVGVVYGIWMSVSQKDLKRLLAYSTIENVGIIGIGLGMGYYGAFSGNEILSMAGFGAAFMHLFNHAFIKSSLFFTTGNVYYATHTRSIDALGGIAKRMPVTAALFFTGALAITALPPLGGFTGKFMLYIGAIQEAGLPGFRNNIEGIVWMLLLPLAGGLAIMAFTKAFGLGFLGAPRSEKAASAKEVSPFMWAIPALLLIVPLFSGFAAPIAINILRKGMAFNSFPPVFDEALQPLMWINLGLVAVFGVIYGIKLWARSTKKIQYGPAWGCGYGKLDARHQYTAASYGESLESLTGKGIGSDVKFRPYHADEIFPGPRRFKTIQVDKPEEKILLKAWQKIAGWLPRLGWAQTGRIQHYLIYPLAFLLIIMILTYFQLI